MKRREQRRLREREQLPEALLKLAQLIPADVDTRRYLIDTFTGGANDDGDAWIEGEGIEKLLSTLGEEACPSGAMDLLAIARRVPRSQSTVQQLNVAELCFALSQYSSPVNVHERRRTAGANSGPVDESSPLLQYYRGTRFAAIVRGEDPSFPAAREQRQSEGTETADSAEWDAFLTSIGTALPMSLRVHHSEPALTKVAERLLQTDPRLCTVVKPFAAFPPTSGLYSCSNADYHTHKETEYMCRTLHASSGVSFQEAVSAIPVAVLGIEPHHSVLDMCAAPGSKTLQALDAMLQDGWSAAVGSGVLVANEKDRVKATQTLPARLKRYHAPHVMSTRCDGTQWPRLYEERSEGAEAVEKQFDRIICDVPCSGDGTVRKERSVATTWSSSYVKSLIPTQRALLRRGLDLLNDGGVLVYSTCSMNPKEDEEVVCAGLELFGDSVEMIDVNAVLREKGYQLHSSGGILSPNVEGLQKGELPAGYDGSKVLRVLPHRDNTGGFFVAAFRKLRQPNWTPPAVVQRKLNQWTKGKLWAPVGVDDDAWCTIASFYGFDRHDEASFRYYTTAAMADKAAETRGASRGIGLVPVYHLNPNGGPTRRIVLVTPALADMVFRTRPFKGPGVEVISVGVRAFEAYDGKFLADAACRWRAVVEAASFLAPRLSARKLVLNADTHAKLLEELLRNGFVYLREYWTTLLGADASVVERNANAQGVVRTESPLAAMVASYAADPAGFATAMEEVVERFTPDIHVGGVLVGVLTAPSSLEEPWWVSATMSGHKLELAIDGSLRTYGLMAYLNIHEGGRGETAAKTDDASGVQADADGNNDE